MSTINKTERWRINAFKVWCWRRFLRVLWRERRPSKSMLKEIRPDYSLERRSWSWSSKASAIWCEESTHWKRSLCWERVKAGGEGDDKGWDGWMASPTQRTWVWASSGRCWRTEKPGVLQSMGLQRVGHNLVTKQQLIFYELHFLLMSNEKDNQ